MARIRSIKPQHVDDKELAGISLQAHLLWVLSWCFSDDEGVFENDALWLKSKIFPRRTDIRVEQIDQWLDQLVKARFIIPFRHQDVGYYIHRTFKTHQRIDKPQPSKIDSNTIRGILLERSENDQITVAPDRIGEDRIGKGLESGADKPPTPAKSYFKVFIPPDRESVRKFFISRVGDSKNAQSWPTDKCRFEADQFFDHYKANGWVQGKAKKIVDWESAALKWMRNAQKGTFEQSAIQKPIPAPIKSEKKSGFSISDKMAKDIGFLYQRFLEDQCTIISIETQYYNFLKSLKMLEFDDFTVGDIREKAVVLMDKNNVEKNEQNLTIYMKKLGVLECFERLKKAGKPVIFELEISRVA